MIPLRALPGGGFFTQPDRFGNSNPMDSVFSTRRILRYQPDRLWIFNPTVFEIGLAGIKWKTLYKSCQGLYDGYKENVCS